VRLLTAGFRAAALASFALAGCTTPQQDGRLAQLERLLAANDSATFALGQWCGQRGFADPPLVTAQTLPEHAEAASSIRNSLAVGADEPLRFRHVRLSCGGRVLSEATNWYVPARLTAEMNRVLDSSNTPFGTVARPLGFRRERLASRHGAALGCGRGTVLSQQAVLWLPDGAPLAVVTECYTLASLGT
jgi:chorismate-pyruvate lyase